MKSGCGGEIPFTQWPQKMGTKEAGPRNKEHLRGPGSAEGSLGEKGVPETLGSKSERVIIIQGRCLFLSLSWSVLEMQSTLSS